MSIDLTHDSLAKVLEDIQRMYDERPEMNLRPSHILIQSKYIRLADRLLNPWRGHRAQWLKRRRK